MKFSVVTPSFNQGAFLPETLASVRIAAEHAPAHEVEHLVMDGGSDDDSVAVLQGQSFARWVSEKDGGQSDAVNKGWAQATGEVLSFLCSDDLWEPETVEKVASVFASHPEIDVVYGDYYFLEGRSGWRRFKKAGPFSTERLRGTCFPSQPATFIRRGVYEKFGGVDPSLRYCMDYEYWLRIAPHTRWHYLEEPLAVMRLHPDAKTTSRLADAWWEAAARLGRYDRGPWPWVAAAWMRCGGQFYYRAKRLWFERAGRSR